MLARKKRLEAKRRESQRLAWEEADKNVSPGGSARKSHQRIGSMTIQETADLYRQKKLQEAKSSRPAKRDIILSCPFCGDHMKTSEKAQHMLRHPANIAKGLWLGDYLMARDKDTLKDKLKITHVLNCAKELPNYHEKSKTFKYKKLVLMDRAKQELGTKIFDGAVNFINDAIESGGQVFVHCQEGKSRSVTMITAYLMTIKEQSLNNAMAMISSKRRIAQPNKGFLEKLRALEMELEQKRAQCTPCDS